MEYVVTSSIIRTGNRSYGFCRRFKFITSIILTTKVFDDQGYTVVAQGRGFCTFSAIHFMLCPIFILQES